MFSGEHIIDLNRKNEIIISRNFLKIIKDRGSKKLFMVPIQDFCLAVFEEGFDLNQISKDYPSFTKSEKWECNINSKGVMIIPQVLKEHIEIDDHVFIIGAGEFFEIWSPKGWERFHNSVRNDFAPAWAIMSKLSKRALKKIARSGKLPKDVEKQISKAIPNKDPEKLEHLFRILFLKNKEQHMEILKSVNGGEETRWEEEIPVLGVIIKLGRKYWRFLLTIKNKSKILFIMALLFSPLILICIIVMLIKGAYDFYILIRNLLSG